MKTKPLLVKLHRPRDLAPMRLIRDSHDFVLNTIVIEEVPDLNIKAVDPYQLLCDSDLTAVGSDHDDRITNADHTTVLRIRLRLSILNLTPNTIWNERWTTENQVQRVSLNEGLCLAQMNLVSALSDVSRRAQWSSPSVLIRSIRFRLRRPATQPLQMLQPSEELACGDRSWREMTLLR